MLVVAATLKAAEGKGDDVEQAFLTLLPNVKQEQGTLTYVVHRGTDDRDKFFVYEKYRAKEDLDFHSSTPHFKEFFKVVGPILAGQPDISFYQELK